MIISHPHTDHYSGFPSLLAHCRNEKIEIDRFWHTAVLNKSFLENLIGEKKNTNDLFDSFVRSKKDRNRLKRLFLKIDNLDGGSILNKAGVANDNSMIRLNEKLWLECLSPSNYELKQYGKGTFGLNQEEELTVRERPNNPYANHLSTFLKISTKDWYILLPSDSMKSTIERVMNQGGGRQQTNSDLKIAQIPHHGSQHSHFEPFWKSIPGRKNVPVFVSVGGKYGLPSKKVIQFFDENYKEVHATNNVGGFKEHHEEKMLRVETLFDMYDTNLIKSKKSSNYCVDPNCGEKKIIINTEGECKVETYP